MLNNSSETQTRFFSYGWRPWSIGLAALFLMLVSSAAFAERVDDQEARQEAVQTEKTLATLESFAQIRRDLKQQIKTVGQQIDAAQTAAEKAELKDRLDKLNGDLKANEVNFKDIAAGVDISILRVEKTKKFDFQEEVMALVKPAFQEIKEMTSDVRQKTELKGRIAYYQARLPILAEALENAEKLQSNTTDKLLQAELQLAVSGWSRQQSIMQSELQAAQYQLDKLIADEASLAEASGSYLKSFFQKRGLYLTEAILVIVGVLLLARISYTGMQRRLPGFRAEHRSFRIRLVELIHRIVTIVLLVIGPMVVFYLEEDWVLFSLGILMLLGIGWGLRQAIPRYWEQILLFLNIGSVRENERINFEGLPWKVDQLNFFSKLINPVAGISLRIPLDELVGLTSRPFDHNEPWFPCRRGDWVILDDGVRGKVTGISSEMVELVQRGGATKTYLTRDFLANSPRNLATNFRIKETIGISYSHQRQSTTTILSTLQEYLLKQIEEEGYGKKLLNLRVEFEKANNSSLDLVVIADFSGDMGDLYNRLRRAVQRWCVDACSEYDWEIPFPQLTLHGGESLRTSSLNR